MEVTENSDCNLLRHAHYVKETKGKENQCLFQGIYFLNNIS